MLTNSDNPSTQGDNARIKGLVSRFSRFCSLHAVARTLPSRSVPDTQTQKPPDISTPSLLSTQPESCSFLGLPRELREIIYDYLRDYPTSYIIHTHAPCKDDINYVLEEKSLNDRIPLSLSTQSGFLAYHGLKPPLNLSLACRQLHCELWDHAFEVGPLTPHDGHWRFDPTYQKLSMSAQLPNVHRVLVRIELVNMRMETPNPFIRHSPIELEDCVSQVQELAEILVRVLRKRAKSLRLITIDWIDDFSKENNWELKASVLLPFGTLEKVQIRRNRVIVAETSRLDTERMLDDTLDGLSAMA